MDFEPKIIAFLCTWCSYTGADTAGISRLKSPANLRAIRVPCSGRVSPEIIMRTFDQGADGVIVLGCHIGECHYDSGNHRTAKRLPVLQNLMAFAGLEAERLRLDWVSASEGERFARIVNEFTDSVRALGPVRWRASSYQWESSLTWEVSEPGNTSEIEWIGNPEIGASHTASIRQTARQLLSTGQADCVIGYESGPRGRIRPYFARTPDEADRLVWNHDCSQNLATYLPHLTSRKGDRQTGRVGIVAKACEVKSINLQLAEQCYDRQQIHVIGVVCQGVREGAGATPYDNHQPTFRPQTRCLSCSNNQPAWCDTLIGEHYSLPATSASDPLNERILALERATPQERLNFWLSQFDRCIRCYACRQACPACNCPSCLYERDDSLWNGMAIALNEKRTFHLGRAYHLAGRCVGCDECERACPLDIPISLLNRKIAQTMTEIFNHEAGINQQPSPLVIALQGEERLS